MQPPAQPQPQPLNVVEIIRHKRDGGTHSAAELTDFITAYTRDEVPDEQVAAWLMA
ncbi:MAG: hypothetical protein ACM3N4_09340, partial [Nitrososphaerota archaeon]